MKEIYTHTYQKIDYSKNMVTKVEFFITNNSKLMVPKTYNKKLWRSTLHGHPFLLSIEWNDRIVVNFTPAYCIYIDRWVGRIGKSTLFLLKSIWRCTNGRLSIKWFIYDNCESKRYVKGFLVWEINKTNKHISYIYNILLLFFPLPSPKASEHDTTRICRNKII